MRQLVYVEIDVDVCSRTYGTAPCTAAIGTTGDRKCFNSLRTCQDIENFGPSVATLRFSRPAQYLPSDIEAIPSIRDISFSPAQLSLGGNLGQRATLTVSFNDHPHSDAGFLSDPYISDRGYDPFRRGTFWGKFRARFPYVQGRNLRVFRGVLGQQLDDMDVRHYVMESIDGPGPDGTFTIVAKDVLKLADNDRAQAPRLANGFLVANITAAATSATLSPAGIGNLEYPASGYVAIAGREICSFTRSGDVLTLTRAQFNTVATAHTAQDRVQPCLFFNGLSPAEIISDLLVNYADIPSGYISDATWQAEVDTFLQRNYTTLIAEPTGVNKLVSELVEQASLAIWWDDATQQIRLRVLREIGSGATSIDEDRIIAGSMAIREQPDKRVSQVWTYFGLINPLAGIDNPSNYRSTALTVDLQLQSNYGSPAVKKLFSRWIPQFGRATALSLNDALLGRFKDPPRRFSFEIFGPHSDGIAMADGCNIAFRTLQDDTGARLPVPSQVTRLNPGSERFQVEAEEALFAPFDGGDLLERVVIIDVDTLDFNLREVHDSLYPEIVDGTGITVKAVVEAGVIVGSSRVPIETTNYVADRWLNPGRAFDVGDWPSGVTVIIELSGDIRAGGGFGGYTGSPSSNSTRSGQNGATAIYTRYPVTIDVIAAGAKIYGGGGGGGAPINGSGGGGAGRQTGRAGVPAGTISGADGTLDAGGAGSVAFFAGGAPGQPGVGSGSLQQGGFGGPAIDGDSYVTLTGDTPDIEGSQIN